MWGCWGVGMGQRHRVPFPMLGLAGARPEPGTWGLAPPGRKVTEILPQLPIIDRAAGWGHLACTARQHHGVQPGMVWHGTRRSAGCHWCAWASHHIRDIPAVP